MLEDKVWDFNAQAEQLLSLLEGRDPLTCKHYLVLKFKSLYEAGIAAGRLYEREGVSPYKNVKDYE